VFAVPGLGPIGRHPDELAAALGWPISRVMAEVARLEAEGAVAFEAGAVSATAVSEFR
jgi:predicted Rossmann fold nucleotide-binding protein DprA/Smf involved in DNA uptake